MYKKMRSSQYVNCTHITAMACFTFMLIFITRVYYEALRSELTEINNQLEYKKSTLLESIYTLQDEMKYFPSELGLNEIFIL